MRNEVIAATSSGVEAVSVLDKKALADLAMWLCNEEAYHEKKRPSTAKLNTPTWRQSCDQFDREQTKNGGYCNDCRDFAGKILSEFDLRVKV